MKTDEKYSNRDAVYDVLMATPRNTDFYFLDFVEKVRAQLKTKGSPARPMEGTIQRDMRRLRASFDIKCVDCRKSIYRIVEE